MGDEKIFIRLDPDDPAVEAAERMNAAMDALRAARGGDRAVGEARRPGEGRFETLRIPRADFTP